MALPLTSLRGLKPEETADDRTSPDADGSSGRILRVGLLIAGLLALVYVASRRAGGPEISQSAGTIEEAVPGGPEETLPGEDRPREELEERAEETVRKEPAEPGEMTVEEEIVDEIVDEAETGDETDETGDETDETGDETDEADDGGRSNEEGGEQRS